MDTVAGFKANNRLFCGLFNPQANGSCMKKQAIFDMLIKVRFGTFYNMFVTLYIFKRVIRERRE